MRKFLIVAVFAFAIFGMLAPAVFAQAPAPKVTITGTFDQVTSGGVNFYDGNYGRTGDREWVARTRFRPDFVFEVGRTKAVMGLEVDLSYGLVRPVQGGPGKNGSAFFSNGASAGITGDKNGSTSDLGLNTDTAGVIEFKWIYTEFDLTGKDSLLPFINVPTVARAGGQPFSSLANSREYALYAGGDFAGVSAVTTWAPNLTTKLAYVMIDKELATYNRTSVASAANGLGLTGKLTRGNDFAIIASPEYTPFKGLDLKPLYSYIRGEGTISGNTRRTAVDRHVGGGASADVAGGAGVNTASAQTTAGCTLGVAGYVAGAGCGNYLNGDPSLAENRHTFGIEANWRMGPWGLAPAFYYQHGTRQIQAAINHPGGAYTVGRVETQADAWLFDTVGSFQSGPLLIEVRGIYSTGNKAGDNLAKRISYYEPLDEDTSYYAGWAQILALGVDYFNGAPSSNGGMATNVGYDRYGRAQLGIRGTYSLTPALNLYTVISPTWTAQKVDTDTGVAAAFGNSGVGNRTIVSNQSQVKGDSRYIGTEWDLGTTWKFAPNTAFDLAGGWLFAGGALDNTECVGGAAGTCAGGTLVKKTANDAWTIASRVRLSF